VTEVDAETILRLSKLK